MHKRVQSRRSGFALLALVILLTLSMSKAAYPFVSAGGSPLHPAVPAAGQNDSPESPSPTQVSPLVGSDSTNMQQVVDLRRRPRVKVTGWLGGNSTNLWRIDNHVLRFNPDSLIKGGIQTGSFATVIARVEDDGQLVAESVSLRPLPGEIGYPLEFRCLIQQIEPRYWMICNRVVLITQNTSIQGQPEIGALAEVKGVRLTGDTVLARSVRVTMPDAYTEVEFEGTIDSLTESVWIVNGITVTISPVTAVRGVPDVGLTAEVRGILQHDGSVLAQSITVKDAGLSSQVDIEGLVEEIEPTYWQVAGAKIFVDSSTFIDDSRAPSDVGMRAQVRAVVRLDRSLLALRIRLTRPN